MLETSFHKHVSFSKFVAMLLLYFCDSILFSKSHKLSELCNVFFQRKNKKNNIKRFLPTGIRYNSW